MAGDRGLGTDDSALDKLVDIAVRIVTRTAVHTPDRDIPWKVNGSGHQPRAVRETTDWTGGLHASSYPAG